LKQRNIRRLNTAEMKFTRHKAGLSLLDHKSEYILEEIYVDPVDKKLAQYK